MLRLVSLISELINILVCFYLKYKFINLPFVIMNCNIHQDVHDKAKHNYDLHKTYKVKLEESFKWINTFNAEVQKIGQAKGTKDALEKQLEEIQVGYCFIFFMHTKTSYVFKK